MKEFINLDGKARGVISKDHNTYLREICKYENGTCQLYDRLRLTSKQLVKDLGSVQHTIYVLGDNYN